MVPPRKFQGNTPYEVFCNALLDYLRSIEIVDSPDVRAEHSPRGTSLRVNPASAAKGGKIKQYLLIAVHDDHLNCHALTDGSTEGTKIIYIAKPHGLRKTPWDGQTIDGISYAFDATDSTKRTANTTETQRVVPYYVEGFSVIYAAEIGTDLGLTVETDPGDPAHGIDPTIENITLLDINADGRAWAKQ